MRVSWRRSGLPLGLALAALAGCGDSTGPGPTLPTPNFIRLQSDAGDYIGQGLEYDYTQTNADITVEGALNELHVRVVGDERWYGIFHVPSTLTQVQVGQYTGLQRAPFHDPAKGGLIWAGEGRECENTLRGAFTIDSVTYVAGQITAIDLSFEQHCAGSGPALRGTIHWRSDDSSAPPGPVNPPPAGLWRPAQGATPATGNFVYLESQPDDWVGQGATYVYTPGNAVFLIDPVGPRIVIEVMGDQTWVAEFLAMNTLARLELGYYGGLQAYGRHNPTKGGFFWSGEGRSCGALGWFVIDSITYSSGVLSSIELRFEQRCDGGPSALRGAIRWTE